MWTSLVLIYVTSALGVVLQKDIDVTADADNVDLSAALRSTRGRWSAGYSRNCMDRVDTGSLSPPYTPQPGRRDQWNVVPPDWPPVEMKPKLVLMFFIGEKVFNADLWVRWFEQADTDNLPFHVIIHAKSDNVSLPSRLKKYLFKQHVENDKCNLWKAQWAVMDPLLKDEKYADISHFMMMSENAVPIKPLRKIYKELEVNPLSRFCIDRNFPHPRAETWWTMRRDDLLWFWRWKDGLLSQHGRGCIDENTWLSSLQERARIWPNMTQIEDECWMYVNWRLERNGGCKDWRRVAYGVDTPVLDVQPHLNASMGHPVAWYNISSDAFNELYQSKHWFARKFVDGAVPVDVASKLF